MLNYILPPIIIIVCVSILITFLFRKAAEIPQEEIVSQAPEIEQKKMSMFFGAVGHFGLKVLERIIHRLKLMSLKFHNLSNDWFQSVREKRQQRMQMQQELREKQIQNVPAQIAHTPAVSSEEKIVRPMVSPRATMPQKTVLKEKNQLEDALIKRIAINPKDIEAYERLGDYYFENQNFGDSLECFKQVLRLSPTHQKAKLRIRRLEGMQRTRRR